MRKIVIDDKLKLPYPVGSDYEGSVSVCDPGDGNWIELPNGSGELCVDTIPAFV